MYAYRIKKYIGSYAAALNGVDAIVFTGGVGENDVNVRKLVCEEMEYLGIQIDEEKNQVRSGEIREINTDDATVKVLIVPTNEELEIVKQCYELLTEDVAVS
jgi:acetate kinase